MKTVVYQSCRMHDVPAWVNRCLQSVEQWTRAQQFDDRFIDDRFFDRVPQWYRRGAGSNVQVITNLARLAVARELLAEGYACTIWIDADILVFDPDAFRIAVAKDFAFRYEDFRIRAHEDLVRRGGQIHSRAWDQHAPALGAFSGPGRWAMATTWRSSKR